MPAAQHGPEAGEQICGHEQRAPHLALPHVHAFVGASRRERAVVAADDDVSQGDRGGAAGHERDVGQEPCEQRAVDFEDTVYCQRMSTPEACRQQQQAEAGGRRGPHIATKREQATH